MNLPPCSPARLCEVCRRVEGKQRWFALLDASPDHKTTCDECWELIFDLNFETLLSRWNERDKQWPGFCGEVFQDTYGESPAWCQRKPHTKGKHRYVMSTGAMEHEFRWPMEAE